MSGAPQRCGAFLLRQAGAATHKAGAPSGCSLLLRHKANAQRLQRGIRCHPSCEAPVNLQGFATNRLTFFEAGIDWKGIGLA
jgi:hypothetical protein